MRDALLAAKARGATVRGEGWGGKRYAKYAVLGAGTARQPQGSTGSANWSASGVDAHDEHVLVREDPAQAQAFASACGRLKVALGTGTLACDTAARAATQVRLPLVTWAALPTPAPALEAWVTHAYVSSG